MKHVHLDPPTRDWNSGEVIAFWWVVLGLVCTLILGLWVWQGHVDRVDEDEEAFAHATKSMQNHGIVWLGSR